MILTLLLDQVFLLRVVLAGVVVTPLIAFLLWFRVPLHYRRSVYFLGLTGPFVAILFLLHESLIRAIGFDSIFTAAILLLVAAALGGLCGWFARRPIAAAAAVPPSDARTSDAAPTPPQ